MNKSQKKRFPEITVKVSGRQCEPHTRYKKYSQCSVLQVLWAI